MITARRLAWEEAAAPDGSLVNNNSRAIACGAIDDPHVADAARQILEGGDQAFRDRAGRYRAAH